MCRSAVIYPAISSESLNTIEFDDDENNSDFEEDDFGFEWPLMRNSPNTHIFACGQCFYPIVRQASVEEIRSRNGVLIGVAFPIIYLFCGIYCSNENFLEQWRTQIRVPGCDLVLSWIDGSVSPDTHFDFLENVFLYHNFDEQHVILMPLLLMSGTVEEIYRLYYAMRGVYFP